LIHHGKKNKIDIYRQSREVANKKIDGGAAFEGKTLMFSHVGYDLK